MKSKNALQIWLKAANTHTLTHTQTVTHLETRFFFFFFDLSAERATPAYIAVQWKERVGQRECERGSEIDRLTQSCSCVVLACVCVCVCALLKKPQKH